MLTLDEVKQAQAQLDEYRQQNQLSAILDSYEALTKDYARLMSDYEEERERRELYKQMVRGSERNPFALVLVDGDGYIFDDAHLRQGEDGGSSAAQQMVQAVKASLERKGIDNCRIMIRIYANVAGLSKALCKVGLAKADKRSLAPLITSFNRSHGLADFIDAGELKEGADSKLRAQLQLYADNAQCRHIYFAACHDVGYINDLAPHTGNKDKFTLVRSPSVRFHDEFAKLNMCIEELPNVFRSVPLELPDPANSFRKLQSADTNDKLIYAAPRQSTSAAGPPPSKSSTGGGGPGTSVCRFFQQGNCRYGKECKNQHVRERLQSANSWRSPDGDGSTAAREHTLSRPRQSPTAETPDYGLLPKTIPRQQVAINKDGYRLDPYLEPLDLEIRLRLASRIRHRRVCNNWHLNGDCDATDCSYDHESLEPELVHALRWLAQTNPCSRGANCRRELCTQGHVCQNRECGYYAGKEKCRLPHAAHRQSLRVSSFVPAVKPPRKDRHLSSTGTASTESDLAESEPSSATNDFGVPVTADEEEDYITSQWLTGSKN